MKIKQIRNATLRVEYAGKTFLVDPWLESKHSAGCFAILPGRPVHAVDPVKDNIPYPIFDLPEPVEKVLSGVDYYLLTHVHPDHIDMLPDGSVGAPLDKAKPIYVQNENDAKILKASHFENINILGNQTECDGINIYKTAARHGTRAHSSEACGVVFNAKDEPTLYIAGDTVWFDGVKDALLKFKPDVVILNACAAEFIEYGRLIMNDEDVECVAKTVPNAKLIISHMDNVPHAAITRRSMKGLLAGRGIDKYFMPEDGEILNF